MAPAALMTFLVTARDTGGGLSLTEITSRHGGVIPDRPGDGQ
jgi:hypothetical protein